MSNGIWGMFYKSRIAVFRPDPKIELGKLVTAWVQVNTVYDSRLRPGEFLGFMDLFFLRPFKDLPPASQQGGYTPLRTGVLFCGPKCDTLRPGDRLKCIAGPVKGTFEIKVIPDAVVNILTGQIDHTEVQVFELTTDTTDVYPEPTDEP